MLCCSNGQNTLRLLDTPRTARARSGWDEKCEVSTFFKKVQKKWSKNRSQYFSFCFDSNTSTTFCKKVLRPGFQNLTARRHLVTPYILFDKKSKNSGRTDERTNERTHGTLNFDYPTDVKSASRKKSQVDDAKSTGFMENLTFWWNLHFELWW